MRLLASWVPRPACYLAVLMFVLVLANPAAVRAADPNVDVRLSADTVEAGSTFTYSVTVAVQGRTNVALAAPPDFGALSVVGQQQVPQFININGRAERRLTLSFSLRARRTGTFEIGGPVFSVDDRQVTTKSVSVKVVPRGKAPRPTLERNSGYFIQTSVQPQRAPWVGEQVTLSYELFADATQLDTVARQLDEPALDDFWIEDLSDRTSTATQMVSVDGKLMERKPMRTYALFPLHAGPITVEPMEMELLVGSFFRRGKEIRIQSNPIELDVQPLPPDAPASFYEGNVGNWTLRVGTDQTMTRVGRAFRLEVSVDGQGQLGRLMLPQLPELPGTRVSKPENISQPRIQSLTIGGTKKAIYTVTPLERGTITIPPIEFSFFDPKAGKYVTQRSEPIEVVVSHGDLPPQPVAESDITRRTLTGGEDMVGSLRETLRSPRLEFSLESRRDPGEFGWWWWVLGAASLATFAGVAAAPTIRTRRERKAPDRARKKRREASLKRLEEAGTDPTEITAAIRDFLYEVHGVPRGVITSAELPRAFRTRGLPAEAAKKLAEALRQCEQARFSPTGGVDEKLATRAQAALTSLPTPDGPRTTSSSAVALLLAAATAAGALAPHGPAVATDADLTAAAQALEAARWEEAIAPLTALASTHPDALDVLYNLGTAAAHAEEYHVARWAIERAAWLAPHDDDVTTNRDVIARIVRLKAIAASRTGRTMDGDEALFWWRTATAIPPWAYGLAMVLAWLGASVLLVVRRRDERAAVRDAAFVGIVVCICAASFAVIATVARTSLIESTEAVVVMKEIELREGPNPAAARKTTPASMVPGTLVRAADRRNGWVKIAWPGNTGWARDDQVRSIR